MPDDLTRALFDPSAPLPAIWPTGPLGIFLLFCIPIGGGIPFGVIMARDAGLSPLATAGLYFLSDLVLAVTTEPMLAILRWLSTRIAFLARLGALLSRLTGSAGLQEGGVRGPLGLILISFSISPTTGRAATAAAGHGFFSGWSLAIIGDMLYFGLLMVTTLWVSSIFGDDRITVGAVLIGTWLLPMVIRRIRRRPASAPAGPVHATPAPLRVAPLPATTPLLSPATSQAPRASRKRGNGSRRASRGLHR